MCDASTLRLNPGGEIEYAFGREDLIQNLWETVAVQSAQLLGERRTGKTTTIKQMERTPQEGYVAFYLDLEACTSPSEFVEKVVGNVTQNLPRLKRVGNWFHDNIWQKLGGIEVNGVLKMPPGREREWKGFLEGTLLALEASHPDKTILFLWDELPLMLENIVTRTGESEAMEILDTLRSLRQRPGSRIRMLFTGSIGLHHILTTLQEAGHGNAAVNDMWIENIKPLSAAYAASLATMLISSAAVPIIEGAQPAVVEAIVVETDGHPFYIQHTLRALQRLRRPVSADDVRDVMASLLEDPQDPMDLSYYVERVRRYYKPELRRDIALEILDAMARTDDPLTLSEALQRVQLKLPDVAEEEIRIVLELLQKDHYIRRRSGTFTFQYSITRRIWRSIRGL